MRLSAIIALRAVAAAPKRPWRAIPVAKVATKPAGSCTPACAGRRPCDQDRNKLCWACLSAVDGTAFFCANKSCGKVQPVAPQVSYFELFGLGERYDVDIKALKRRFLNYQSSVHPDNFSRRSPEEQRFSDAQSTLVNRAYAVLRDPERRAAYLLERRGERVGAEDARAANGALLLAVLEQREEADAAAALADPTARRAALQALADANCGRIADLRASLGSYLASSPPTAEQVLAAKACLEELSYWHRLERELDGLLSS